MSAGVYGCLGRAEPQVLQKLGDNLGHRGLRAVAALSTPEVQLLAREDAAPHRPHVSRTPAPLVFAGRILNRHVLIDITGAAPGVSDADLLWALYTKSGPYGFQHVNGAYAAALFDAHSRSLVLVTDPWAVQPLHFARSGGAWLFASEYKGLLAALGQPCAIDRSVVAHVLASKYLPLHQTLDARITALGPGEFARLSADHCDVACYQPFQLEIDARTSETQQAAELRERILVGAERLTQGHEAIGVGLSGGLDSVLTLGAIRKVAPHKRIYAYTASFDARDPLLANAAQTAQRFRAEHRAIAITTDELIESLPEVAWRMEDPVGREEMVVYHAIATRAARETSLMVYGHMADILFAGMPRHLLIKAASEFGVLKRPITEFYDYTQTGAQPHTWSAKLLVNAYFHGRHPAPPHVHGAHEELEDKTLHLAAEQPLNHALFEAASAPSEVGAIERLHAWAGVAMGSIFHDLEVGRCAFRIPDERKIRGRRSKHILRLASRGLIPEDCAQRPKDLIRLPLPARVAVQEVAERLLTEDVIRARDIFEPQEIAELRQRVAVSRRIDHDFYYLWSLVLLELWFRLFADDKAQTPKREELLSRTIRGAARPGSPSPTAVQRGARQQPGA